MMVVKVIVPLQFLLNTSIIHYCEKKKSKHGRIWLNSSSFSPKYPSNLPSNALALNLFLGSFSLIYIALAEIEIGNQKTKITCISNNPFCHPSLSFFISKVETLEHVCRPNNLKMYFLLQTYLFIHFMIQFQGF